VTTLLYNSIVVLVVFVFIVGISFVKELVLKWMCFSGSPLAGQMFFRATLFVSYYQVLRNCRIINLVACYLLMLHY